MDELVTGLAATTQHVEKGIDNGIEHTHAHTADKSAKQINPVSAAAANLTAHILENQANYAHDEGCKRRLFVTHLSDEHAAGNTHQQVGDKVGIVADLSSGFRSAELVLDDGCHGGAQVGHEGNHCEERDHHNNRSPLFGFLSHFYNLFI